MVFTVAFFFNTSANFLFGVVMSALLGPAEFGRFATVALAALTVGGALLDWLRFSALRFAGDDNARARTAASLDVGYLSMMGVLCVGAGIVAWSGQTFGLTPMLLALTPLLAIAYNRVEYSGVQFRVREQPRAFAALYGMRQLLAFTVVLAVAYFTRDAGDSVAALVIVNLVPSIVLAPALRVKGARLRDASPESLKQFLVYAKPIVASFVIYSLIALINRQAALDHLGADATGKLSLATDLGQRLFQAINSLPEMLLFQYALSRERKEGLAAAERQLSINSTMVLALLAPMTAGYMILAPTFEAIAVPKAYHGAFADLTWDLAPGFLAFCAISSMTNPVLQLAKRTWPLTIAALCALGADLIQLKFFNAGADLHSLAQAYSISLGIGYVVGATLALRNPAVRPAVRDIAVVVLATLSMAHVARPFNGLTASALVNAMGAVALGGALYAAVILAFDVAGLRTLIFGWVRERRARAAATVASTLS